MVFHSHILITLICTLQQTPKLSDLMQKWADVDVILRSFETSRNELNIHSRIVRVLNVTKWGKLRDTKSWALVVTYITLAFVGGVSYFATVWLKENLSSWVEYLTHVAQIYVIQEIAFPAVGVYILYLGKWKFWDKCDKTNQGLILYFVIAFAGHMQELLWAFGDIYLLSVVLSLTKQYKRFNKVFRKAIQEHPISPLDLDSLRVLHITLTKITKVKLVFIKSKI